MDGANFEQHGSLPIYKIVYLSEINIPGGGDVVSLEIQNILAWSRAWNPRHGVTGALLVNNKNFAQVIEGPSASVKHLFGQIVCDRRHQNVQLLQADLFKERDFGNWSMAYAGEAGEPDLQLASDPLRHPEHFAPGARSTMALLRWLVLEKRQTVYAA